ncbi:LOW QUALITY PROTEIN: hypothetical protein OSB04_004772 [Centaurea solstitialis]|uniref:Uncharacterized protein n=1 Tax=Centaurea solstitialis TaxID=347529 RepID=A0AA38WFS1_9ASTR|nr:LOW QUALITY PROTEIN: hypothetical protein OSB04_004772 [Centaurea solstitialis]
MAEQNFFAGDYSGAGECYFGHHKPTEFNNHCNSSVSGSEAPFSSSGNVSRFSESRFSGVEMCLPYDDLGELEWLSNLTHDQSFSTADEFPFQFRDSKFISAPVIETPATATSSSHTTSPEFRSQPLVTTRTNSQIFQTEVFVPQTIPIAPCNWTSRIRHLKSSSASKTAIKTHKPTSFFQVLEPSEGTSFKKQRRGEKNLPTTSNGKRRRRLSSDAVVRSSRTFGDHQVPALRIRYDAAVALGPNGAQDALQRVWGPLQVGSVGTRIPTRSQPDLRVGKAFELAPEVMEIRRQKELRNVNRESVDRGSVLDGSDGGGCLMDRQSGPDLLLLSILKYCKLRICKLVLASMIMYR